MKYCKDKPSVCFVVWGASPIFKSKDKFKYGGAEYQVSLWLRSLSKHYNLSLINGYKNDGFKSSGVRIFSIKSGKNNRDNVVTKIIDKYRLLKLMRHCKADVYVNRVGDVNTMFVGLFCKLNKKKFVFMVSHDLECNLKFFNKSLVKKFCFWMGLKLADLIIVQTETQEEIIKSGFGPKTAMIRNIVDLQLFNKQTNSEEKWIVWIGRLVPWKQPELFLDLAKRHPQEKFVMVGLTDIMDPAFAKKISNSAKKIKNIEFIPGLSWDGVNALIAESKFLVNTSESEGFPNTFLQSAVLGKPVLSFRVDPDGLINRNKFGYCAEGRVEDFFNLASELLSKEKDRRLTGRQFRSFVLKNHNKDLNTKKMTLLINDLLVR